MCVSLVLLGLGTREPGATDLALPETRGGRSDRGLGQGLGQVGQSSRRGWQPRANTAASSSVLTRLWPSWLASSSEMARVRAAWWFEERRELCSGGRLTGGSPNSGSPTSHPQQNLVPLRATDRSGQKRTGTTCWGVFKLAQRTLGRVKSSTGLSGVPSGDARSAQAWGKVWAFQGEGLRRARGAC